MGPSIAQTTMTETAPANAHRDPRYEEHVDENWPNQSDAGFFTACRFEDEPFATLRMSYAGLREPAISMTAPTAQSTPPTAGESF